MGWLGKIIHPILSAFSYNVKYYCCSCGVEVSGRVPRFVLTFPNGMKTNALCESCVKGVYNAHLDYCLEIGIQWEPLKEEKVFWEIEDCTRR